MAWKDSVKTYGKELDVEVKISDTILYKIHYGENNDSNINIVVAIQPYMLINRMTKKITSYDISFEKKSNSDSFLKRRKTTNQTRCGRTRQND